MHRGRGEGKVEACFKRVIPSCNVLFSAMIHSGRRGTRPAMECKEELMTAAALQTLRRREKFRTSAYLPPVCALIAG
jgi:hypothetical protein